MVQESANTQRRVKANCAKLCANMNWQQPELAVDVGLTPCYRDSLLPVLNRILHCGMYGGATHSQPSDVGKLYRSRP
jgi:hypothetical protein